MTIIILATVLWLLGVPWPAILFTIILFALLRGPR
jgi:hypothetical protein